MQTIFGGWQLFCWILRVKWAPKLRGKMVSTALCLRKDCISLGLGELLLTTTLPKLAFKLYTAFLQDPLSFAYVLIFGQISVQREAFHSHVVELCRSHIFHWDLPKRRGAEQCSTIEALWNAWAFFGQRPLVVANLCNTIGQPVNVSMAFVCHNLQHQGGNLYHVTDMHNLTTSPGFKKVAKGGNWSLCTGKKNQPKSSSI